LVVGFGDYRARLEELADPERTLFTGPLEHRHLVHLLALADVCVVPSIFPEAFGMVAAEAGGGGGPPPGAPPPPPAPHTPPRHAGDPPPPPARAACPPLVARHSGLAEIAAGLEAEYPPTLRALASFRTGDVADLRGKLRALLALPAADRRVLSEAARRAAVRRWSWAEVAERLLVLSR
ncbi:MAG: glycosyltransferase, partial [Gaiellaceae bacterium]|nr:glycosyltransferase [Gaiellaceae bacterium]